MVTVGGSTARPTMMGRFMGMKADDLNGSGMISLVWAWTVESTTYLMSQSWRWE